ncbi:MAG: c-type cytochrome [Gammaproteobacteria bacterium]|nr:c-type cytochrome [Gammaproteobacteria bacterium]
MSIDTTQHRRFGTQALVPALALLILLGAGCSEKETASPQDAASAPQIAEPGASPPAEAPEPTNEPDASQAAAEPPAADKPADTQTGSVDGQKIYQKSCQVCHAAGVAGAPKLGDKDAWAPRIAKGNDALFLSVKNGLKAMPPKGTCMSCSEDELRAAMEYMVEQGS